VRFATCGDTAGFLPSTSLDTQTNVYGSGPLVVMYDGWVSSTMVTTPMSRSYGTGFVSRSSAPVADISNVPGGTVGDRGRKAAVRRQDYDFSAVQIDHAGVPPPFC